MSSSNSKKLIIILAILIAASLVAAFIIKTAPKPLKGKPEEVVRLVETKPLNKQSIAPHWKAGGEVIAKQRTQLMPRVSGQIVWINPQAIPGAILAEGAVLARIDAEDFELAVAQRKAEVAQAEAQLLTEQGQGTIARQEFEMAQAQMPDQTLNNEDKALVLREPQIKSAQAALKSAKAMLKQAQLNLARTEIRMPYDGAIVSRDISVGSQVSSASKSFDVVDTSEFWLEVKVARQFNTWLDIDKPALVRSSSWPADIKRDAKILSRMADVNTSDRQSQVVLSIEQPLNDEAGNKVFLGDYLDVELVGKTPAESYVIEAARLLTDDQVWVVNNNLLHKRQVTVRYKGRDKVWISAGFEAGDALLDSSIRSLTPGTKVRIKAENKTPTGEAQL